MLVKLIILAVWGSLLVGLQCSSSNQTESKSLSQENSTASRPLLSKQSAPYAIDSVTNQQVKNLVFRLSLNQTARDELDNREPWTFVSQNGTVLGQKANLDLRKLLETLNSNNFTSELMMDDASPGLVNITISNASGHVEGGDYDADSGRRFLEDLLSESRLAPAGSVNASSVVKDNHRYISKHPVRSKPSLVELSIPMTVPPIRRTMDVVADNYTTRKIADEANIFALKLLHQINIEKLGRHNVVQSPFAVYEGLTLLLSGAMGDTCKELDRCLLGSQSVYENTKLTHDQDRSRLLSSLNDVIKQLRSSATNHFQVSQCSNESLSTGACDSTTDTQSSVKYEGGNEEQHLVMANNLLFSPGAFEISNEFKNLQSSFYNDTALTKIEVGSTESIQVLNGWIRRATAGLIPGIFKRKSTFDEFNVMTLLTTSWLAQEWRDNFKKVSSALRTNIRLKGQVVGALPRQARQQVGLKDEPLMEFVDDMKNSHFVDYIRSELTRNIHHYHSILNGQLVDVVVVPFRNSNQRMVVLTPLIGSGPLAASPVNQTAPEVPSGAAAAAGAATEEDPSVEPPDSSSLSKLIAILSNNPRKALRSLWHTIAPEIITKKVYQNMQQAMQNASGSASSSSSLSTPEDSLPILANIPPKVRLSMPLIRSEADASLSASLNHIGIVNSFDPTQANFIGINGHPFNHYKLHLSNVMYKTTLNLNEHGINYDRTVKTLESMRLSATKAKNRINSKEYDVQETNNREMVDEIKLNKPFVYLICDMKTKLILYTGVVRNPAIESPAFNKVMS